MTSEAMEKLPIIPIPTRVRFQPLAAEEVASRLAELALGAPAGLVPEMAGPQIFDWADLVRSHLAASGRRRLIVPMPVFGGAASAIRAGANLAPDRAVGRQTWAEFLAARYPGGAVRSAVRGG